MVPERGFAVVSMSNAGPDGIPFNQAVGLLPGDSDEYTSGAFKGQRGFFTRDDSGAVTGVDLAGRLFNRVPIRKT